MRICLLFTFIVLGVCVATSRAQSYTATWVGNSYGDNAHHVGNCARSMWVATNGMIYTASFWDENAGGIGIYQNGQTLGSAGGHGEVQGCSITGNSLWIFAEEQGVNGGQVGRYNRSTLVRELLFTVSSTNGDSVPGLAISPVNGLLYASDNPGNRVRVFNANGIWQRDWTVSGPGRLAIDEAGNVWVAQMTNGTILEFNSTGGALNSISMGVSNRPSVLYVDAQNQLWVGDEGAYMNINIYTNLTGAPRLSGTYGVAGGYLSTAGGAMKGQTGAKRFTRVVGIGGDNLGNVYVLNNPWGGTWDLGRNGGTDLHCYNNSGSLIWTLQSLNFEGIAAADLGSDGTNLYSGEFIFTGTGGGGFVANTIDPFTYPTDQRINVGDQGRGSDFAMLSTVGPHRLLMACGQNPDIFYSYYFNASNSYIAQPGPAWGTNHERNGFCLDSAGNVWEGRDKTSAIWFSQLLGFDTNGAPLYAAATSTPTPASIGQLNRILYLPSSDTMILAGGSSDWTAVGGRVEVYKGWRAGNTSAPNPVITLNTNLNPKSIAAAGSYMFVGYVHTVPNIDVFNLTNGRVELTMTNANPGAVYVGNDVDSMYGVTAFQKANGQYIVTKDNYNASSAVIHVFTPAGLPVVTGINPSSPVTGSSGAQSMSVSGINFLPGSIVILSNTDTAVSYNPPILFANGSNLTVNANFSVTPHNWSVQVINPDNTASAPLGFTVQAPPRPGIDRISMHSGSMVLSGTNGTPGLTFSVLSSTNVAQPFSNWTLAGTNVFGDGGSFNWTNSYDPSSPEMFYIIRL